MNCISYNVNKGDFSFFFIKRFFVWDFFVRFVSVIKKQVGNEESVVIYYIPNINFLLFNTKNANVRRRHSLLSFFPTH